MKTPKWICSKCNQPFTRKWNANRHCNNKHSGRIENIVSFTEHVMNSKSRYILSDHFYQNNSYPLNIKTQLFDNKSTFVNDLQINTLTDPLDDAKGYELLSYELFDKLAPKYREMQDILDFLPEQNKKQILGYALSTAIFSKNPLKYFNNQLQNLHKNKIREIMLDDLSSIYGSNKEYMKEFLKSILEARYLSDY
jgi:hypothetical protein